MSLLYKFIQFASTLLSIFYFYLEIETLQCLWLLEQVISVEVLLSQYVLCLQLIKCHHTVQRVINFSLFVPHKSHVSFYVRCYINQVLLF